tara:strand:+ start:304 stop:486 length:183 start_codon:yes stop_codon:yes gene_type:complete
MRNEAKYFPDSGNDEYVNEGPKSPIAGPTFPRLAAETPNEDLKSKPIIVKKNTPEINNKI